MNKPLRKNSKRKAGYALLMITTFPLLQNNSAHAYLDPGSGSILLQALIAALAVAGGAISMFWGKVTSFFKRPSARKKDENTNSCIGTNGKD